ncbi:MAG: hypothetical protein QOF61_38 [Acidobacteriota bacterium]|jgi:hypothetical protein|nr:hypothetical protein [Acidobacteriota bacterium]
MKQRDKSARRGERPRAAVDAAPPTGAESPVNDMEDAPAETAGYTPQLASALAHFQARCAAHFNESDAAALRQQRAHRRIVRTFSVAGTFAVTFSILHLTRLLPLEGQTWLIRSLALGLFAGELIAVLFAVGAVIYGIVRASQGHWLVGRHKAEMLRLLKFRMLLDPSLVAGSDARRGEWEAKLAREIERIDRVDESALREWVEETRVPDVPLCPPGAIDAGVIRDALDYYRRKRLDPQRSYFFKQAERNLRWDWSTRLVPPLLFFGSVLFALVHLVAEAFEIHESGWDDYFKNWAGGASPLAVVCIILAAILPAFGAGLRGLRSAYEFSRNTLRFRAIHFALEMLRERLSRDDARPEEIWRDLWWCEWLLEAEHREWLRLMIEAEWIG